MDIKESWFEKLGRWEEALATYEEREKQFPGSIDALVGQLRSLYHLWEWDRLSSLSSVVFKKLKSDTNDSGSSATESNTNTGMDSGSMEMDTGADEFVIARAGNDAPSERPRIETQGSDDSAHSGDFSGLNYTMAGFEEVGYLGAQAAWALGQWDDMSTYVQVTNENTLNGAYLRAIINVHHDRFSAAQKMVDKARSLLDKTMTAMIRESYNRAYKHIH